MDTAFYYIDNYNSTIFKFLEKEMKIEYKTEENMIMDKSAELDRTLNRVMDMLKFAEAKNAILLTFEAGIFYALFTELPEVLSEKPLLKFCSKFK